MCAIVTQKTSILSTYGIKNANELHRTFFERAKCLLEKRFDWPQINTIQALIILSLLGSGMNNAASAYQYIGIACRQAIELGMHKNISLVRSSPESHTCSEKVSHLTWLCLYIVDRYVSTYLGRPLAVSDHDVTISLPNCDSNTTPAGNLSLHVKLCAILGKISDAINRSSNLSVMKTEDLLKTFNNLKPKLLSMQSYVPTPKGSDSWSVNHHLYLLYRASYILLHRLTPGLIDISCVNRAIEISRLLSPILLSNHSEEVERFDYKEYVFIMPVVVYFALTGASLLLDVYIKQTFKRPNSKEQTLSNSESASARDDPKLHLPSDLNLKDEIMKFVTIFDKLKDVSLYSVYYKKIIVEGLNSLMTHQSESTTIVPQTPTNTPDSSPHVRDSNPPSSYDPESQDNGLLSMLVDLGHRPEIDDFFAYRHPLINYRNHAQPPAPDPSTVGTLGCVQRSSQRAKRISNPTSKIACDTSDNNTPQALPVSQGPILPRADPAKSVDTFTTAQDWINWDKPADYLQKSSCPYDADVLPTEKPPFQVPRNDPAIQFLELNECWKSLNSRGGYELLIDEEYNN